MAPALPGPGGQDDRELCLEQVLPADAAGDGLTLQLTSAHPVSGHCLFEWGWELAALQRCDSGKGSGCVNCVRARFPA